MKYKKGDKVKVIGNIGRHDYRVGMKYSVDEYNTRYGCYKLKSFISEDPWIYDEDLELVEPDMSEIPEVGDSIEITKDISNYSKGQRYPITRVCPDDIGFPFRTLDNKGTFNCPSQLYYKLIKKQSNMKLAIRVENEEEFNLLMDHYTELGWTWASVVKPKEWSYHCPSVNVVVYKDACTTDPEGESDNTISYKVLAHLKGLPLTKTHKITIDGKDIELSSESFKAFKDQFKD